MYVRACVLAWVVSAWAVGAHHRIDPCPRLLSRCRVPRYDSLLIVSFFLQSQQQLDVQLVAAEDSGSSSASAPTRLGLVQLTDLEVNAAALNGYLEGRPLRLVRGRVARVEVRVCYEKLLTEEGLKITLEGLDLLLAPAPPAGAAASRRRRQSAPSSSGGGDGGDTTDDDEQAGNAGIGAGPPPRSTQGRTADVEADSATGIIADWIEQMAAQMRVEVKGLTVRVLGSAEEGPLLRLDVAKVRYEDVTARYQGASALSASSMAAGGGEGAGAPPTAAHPPSCVSHKVCMWVRVLMRRWIRIF